MNIQNNLSPSFGSTTVLYSSKLGLGKICEELGSSFDLRGVAKKTPEQVRQILKGNQAALNISPEGLQIVGRDRADDEYIARRIIQLDPLHTRYVEDTPKAEFNGKFFEILA